MAEKQDPMDTMGVELKEATRQADAVDTIDHFTMRLRKPFTWEGKDYTELEFDFGTLTGADFLNIETEVSAAGYSVIVPEFSTMFLMTMAFRCCKQPIGTDVIRQLPFVLFNRIRSRARSFLMNSGI